MLLDQARPAALGLHREAAPELELAVDQIGLAAPDRVELHALAVQPAHRVARAADQAVAQLAVGAVLRDAEHVVVELVLGVGAEVGAVDLVLGQVRHDRLEVVDAVIDAAEGAGGEAGVAAHQLLRRALDHQHLGALLAPPPAPRRTPRCRRRPPPHRTSCHDQFLPNPPVRSGPFPRPNRQIAQPLSREPGASLRCRRDAPRKDVHAEADARRSAACPGATEFHRQRPHPAHKIAPGGTTARASRSRDRSIVCADCCLPRLPSSPSPPCPRAPRASRSSTRARP